MQKKRIKTYIICFIFCFIFSLCINVMISIGYKKSLIENFIYNYHFNFSFFIKSLFMTIPILLVLLLLFKLISKINIKKSSNLYSKKLLCAISFISIFSSGFLFLLTYYPGSNMNDTLASIQGPITASTQHPLFYNLWISIPFRIFLKIFNNMNFSFFLLGIIQLTVSATIITYLIWWYHKTFKNKIGTIILLIYFTVMSIVANYNTVIIKDSIFSVLMLLYIPVIYNIVITKGNCLNATKHLIYTITVFLITALIRNNGIYIIIFLSIIFLILYRKVWKKIIIMLLTIVILQKIPNLITSQKPLFQEKIGIPLQQIAYIVSYNLDSISNEDLEYLNKIMKLEDIKSNYTIYYVDTIKWHKDFNREYLDQTKGRFIKTWLNNLPNNFENYIKSYLLTTYDLWTISKFNSDQSRFFGITKSGYYNQDYFKNLENKRIFPQAIQTCLDNYYKRATIFFGNGTCFWILVIILLYILYKENINILIFTMPLIGLWLTLMISSPLSYALRYMGPYIYLLPFIILITICTCNNVNQK